MSSLRRTLTVLVGTIVAAVLVGCAPMASPAASGNPAASTPSRSTVASGPIEPLAGGDCTKVLETRAVVAALHAQTLTSANIADPLLSVVGGIDCRDIFSTSAAGDPEIDLQVAPSSIAAAKKIESSLRATRCGDDPADDDLTLCTATVARSGWWYRLSVGGLDSDSGLTASRASFAAVTASLERTLQATPAPGKVAAARAFDCASAAAVGWPVSGSRSESYAFEPSHTALREAALALAGPETCEFTSPHGEKWALTVYPRDASAYDACTRLEAGAQARNTTISVPGISKALALATDGSGSEVCATDGVSLVFALRERPDSPPWNAAARTTLGSLLAPVFAAIR